MEHVLSVKHIPFHIVDIATNEEHKLRMRELCGDPTALPPKIFKGNTYLGVIKKAINSYHKRKFLLTIEFNSFTFLLFNTKKKYKYSRKYLVNPKKFF